MRHFGGHVVQVVGYADRLSVPAGARIEFKVSCARTWFTPELVRLRRGGSERHEVDLVEQAVPASLPYRLPGRVQPTRSGSYLEARVPAAVGLRELTLAVWMMPTLLSDERQAVLAVRSGSQRDPDNGTEVSLAVTGHGVALLAEDTEVAVLPVALVPGQWAFVAATVDVAGAARLRLHQPSPGSHQPGPAAGVNHPARTGRMSPLPAAAGGCIRVGARGLPTGPAALFNGKLARPTVAAVALPDAALDRLAEGADPVALVAPAHLCAPDLTAEPGGCAVPDRGRLTEGARIVNLPTRAVPGPFWTGAETDYRRAKAEFDAIHLHDDDLADAGWATDLSWTVPPELPSGVYALKITAEDQVDRIPFVVTPPPASAQPPGPTEPPVLLILPTWTYLAYANWRTYAEHEQLRVGLYGERRGVDPRDHWLAEHPEFGRSLYDVHSDGSGVAYSSRLRPIVNLRPDYFTPTTRGLRHFAQDLQLIEWLDRRGEHYAVVTDDEVEREGAALLSRYRVVLTGSHPEYCSAGMLDSYLHYTHSGGRLMYLGGNGFYQVTARHPGQPSAIEIRRGNAGVATWTSAPGETHLSATGEPGGLWRLRGRPPNLLAGVGFTAQGFDAASGYRRSRDSADPAVAWVFDGVRAGAGELFGTEGPGLHGAAGDELDRADTQLGTPADAVVLASSEGHSAKIELVPEEADLPYTDPPDGIHPKVRSDLVLLARPGGGAVFSVGSIAWSTAMSHAGGDNDVARLTGNVLDRFRDDPGCVLIPRR
jgi:N,N-dimethylformamidase